MKIRLDFVTNSSSSSFIALGIGDDEIAHFITTILGGRQEAYSDWRVGHLEIFDGVTSVTTTLDYGRFYVHNQLEDDERSPEEIEADNREGRKAHNILPALLAFFPSLSNDQERHLEKLVKAAAERGGTCAEVYIDETDGFEDREFDWWDFSAEAKNYVPDHFKVENGKLLSYDERKMQFDVLFLPRSITELSSGVFKGCKFKAIEGSAYMQEPGIFIDCKNLECVEFVGSPYVPQDTFKGCTNLKSVTLPNDVYGIEKGAFAGCASLENINIPKTIEFIEEGAFEGCALLAKLNPALWQRICSMPKSKSEFLDKIEADLRYIISHGGASFKPGRHDYFEIIKSTKKRYELWHSMYDPCIEEMSSLDYGMKFAVYAERTYANKIFYTVSEAIKHLRWKRTQDVSEFTDILVIDTKEIYQFDRFVQKQNHIKQGRIDVAESYGRNLLEKAVEIKKNGGKIKIISLNNLLDLLTKRAFNEDFEAERVKAQREAAKAAKKENEDSQCAELIASIVAKSKELGVLFTNAEIIALIGESEVSPRRFEKYISDLSGMTVKDFFEERGVLKTARTEFYAIVEFLKRRYESKAKVADVTALIADNADIDLSILSNNAKRFTGLSTREYLLQEGILCVVEVKSTETLTEGVLYKPGEEPANIKARIDMLFEKLNGAYPDKVIVGLHKDHKKWGETVTDLYRKLGYKSGADFLTAYGYKMSDDKGGRPKTDHTSTIEELKRRYPDGASFKTADEFIAANADISGQLSTLRKDANQVLGMTFGKWLKANGFIG